MSLVWFIFLSVYCWKQLKCRASVFEEQLGHFDIVSQGVGLVERHVRVEEKLFFSSAAGAIGALNVFNGELLWRNVQPSRTVDKLIVHKKQLIVLSRSTTANATLLSGWTANGRLQWDISIGEAFFIDGAPIVDIISNSQLNIITVLSGNVLHFVQPVGSSVTSRYWNGNELSLSTEGKVDSYKHRLVLFGLLVPTTFTADLSDGSINGFNRRSLRVANGCLVAKRPAMESVAGSSKCDKTAVVKIQADMLSFDDNLRTQNEAEYSALTTSVTVDFFPPMPGTTANFAHFGGVIAVVASDDRFGYLADDVLFGLTARVLAADSVSSAGVGSVANVLSLKDMKQHQLGLPDEMQAWLIAAGSQASVRRLEIQSEAFVFVSVAGAEAQQQIQPAISLCATTYTNENKTSEFGHACFTYSVVQDSAAKTWRWNALNAAGCVSGGTGRSATVLEPYQYYERLIGNVHCVASSVSEMPSQLQWLDVVSTATLQAASDIPDQTVPVAATRSSHLEMKLPVMVDPQKGAIAHIAVSLLQARSNAGGAIRSGDKRRKDSLIKDSYLVLVTLHNGLMLMIHADVGGQSNQSVLWLRHDSAATGMQEVLLVDKRSALDVVSSVHATSDVLQDSSEAGSDGIALLLPTLAERLVAQQHELETVVSRVRVALTDLPSQLSAWTSTMRQYIVPRSAAAAATGKVGAAGVGGSGTSTSSSSELQVLGLDKLAVVLSYKGKSLERLRLQDAKLQLFCLDLTATAPYNVMWSVFVDVPIHWGDVFVTFAKLLPGLAPPRDHMLIDTGSASRSVVSTETMRDGAMAKDLFVWTMDARTGRTVSQTARNTHSSEDTDVEFRTGMSLKATCSLLSRQTQHLQPALRLSGRSVSTVSAGVVDFVDGSTGSVFFLIHPEIDGSISSVSALTPHSLLVASSAVDAGSVRVRHQFVHSIDHKFALFLFYKVLSAPMSVNCSAVDDLQTCDLDSPSLPTFPVQLVATISLDPAVEKVLNVNYPVAQDVVHSRFTILGDDSVLVKYLNPNLMLVTTVVNDYGAGTSNDDDSASSSANRLHATVVDSVTGKVVKRFVLAAGSEVRPDSVQSLLVENFVLISYWNEATKRSEITTIALFDGVLDKYEISPIMSSYSTAAATSKYRGRNREVSAASGSKTSAFSSALVPMHIEKTYVVPRLVTAMSHTLSSSGIANKNVLLAFGNGQVYSVDLRLLHPRRPHTDPSPAEKEEGLLKYNPFVALSPQSAVTLNYAMHTGATKLLSAPSRIESTCVVFAYASDCASLDYQFNSRVAPSQGFDRLADDFNHPLLLLILLALAATVLWLRGMHLRKELNASWK